MTYEVSDCIRATILRWGRQKRRIWTGQGDWYRDSKGLRKVHIDGYAESFMGKLMEERDGTNQGPRRQRWDEVLWGDGLDVQRSLRGMAEDPFLAVHLKYVFDPEFGLTMERKARLIDMGLTKFKQMIGLAEQHIGLKLAAATQPMEVIHKIVREALLFPSRAHINSQAGQAAPELNWAAMNRPTLKVSNGSP